MILPCPLQIKCKRCLCLKLNSNKIRLRIRPRLQVPGRLSGSRSSPSCSYIPHLHDLLVKMYVQSVFRQQEFIRKSKFSFFCTSNWTKDVSVYFQKYRCWRNWVSVMRVEWRMGSLNRFWSRITRTWKSKRCLRCCCQSHCTNSAYRLLKVLGDSVLVFYCIWWCRCLVEVVSCSRLVACMHRSSDRLSKLPLEM